MLSVPKGKVHPCEQVQTQIHLGLHPPKRGTQFGTSVQENVPSNSWSEERWYDHVLFGEEIGEGN